MPAVAEKRAVSPTPEKRARVRGKAPTKQTINFAMVGVKRVNWLAAVPAILAIVVAAALFGKFLVYDRLMEVASARRETEAVRQELEAGYAQIEGFGELNDVYAHYTYSGMTEEESSRVDRVAVMELLERVVFPRTRASAWTLTGNQLTMNISGGTLQEINAVVEALYQDALVDYCVVNTAATNSSEGSGGETVTANVVVQLASPAREQGEGADAR